MWSPSPSHTHYIHLRYLSLGLLISGSNTVQLMEKKTSEQIASKPLPLQTLTGYVLLQDYTWCMSSLKEQAARELIPEQIFGWMVALVYDCTFVMPWHFSLCSDTFTNALPRDTASSHCLNLNIRHVKSNANACAGTYIKSPAWKEDLHLTLVIFLVVLISL